MKQQKQVLNPLKDADIVIFGGLGDLSIRKILPALFYRLQAGQINSNSKIIIVSRKAKNPKEFREFLSKKLAHLLTNVDSFSVFLEMCKYYQADLTSEKSLTGLSSLLRKSELIVRIFYYSTSSSLFASISKNLSSLGLITNETRVVLEKPLGYDSMSSESINRNITSYFNESQIFRIDHYLGKETVQNLMVLRFANNIYENAWNSQHIENVEITVFEELGVGSRGDYYDKYGALLDMVQNHLLQLLCLVAMEPPSLLDADTVRDEKLKVLKSLRFFNSNTIKGGTSRGQYTRGQVKGDSVKSYLEDISHFNSDTETYTSVLANVDNWRWAGVPFYLRTGKRMPNRFSEIVINFKNVPHNIFPDGKEIVNNKLIISLQPEERIELVQTVKIPGPGGYRYKPTSLVLDYSSSFTERFPEAYERLLIDVIRGNQTLFMRNDEVEASWKWIDSISQNWKKSKIKNHLYNAGSPGPGDDILLNGHYWNK
jgi:glucose-6-phosphate 1-dehydrogenase